MQRRRGCVECGIPNYSHMHNYRRKWRGPLRHAVETKLDATREKVEADIFFRLQLQQPLKPLCVCSRWKNHCHRCERRPNRGVDEFANVAAVWGIHEGMQAIHVVIFIPSKRRVCRIKQTASRVAFAGAQVHVKITNALTQNERRPTSLKQPIRRLPVAALRTKQRGA